MGLMVSVPTTRSLTVLALVGLLAPVTGPPSTPAAGTPRASAVPPAPGGVDGQQAAPGAPGTAATWSPGDKDGFGTAVRAPASKVWYTLNNGTLSEVYHPRIDTPGSRDTQLVVSDGATFTDREDTDTVHRTHLVDPRALVYRQVNTARSG